MTHGRSRWDVVFLVFVVIAKLKGLIVEFQEQLDRLQALVDALLVHKHAGDGAVLVDVQCVEDVLYDARRQRCIDKRAIEDAKKQDEVEKPE